MAARHAPLPKDRVKVVYVTNYLFKPINLFVHKEVRSVKLLFSGDLLF